MKRRQTDFRSVPDKNKNKRDFQKLRIETRSENNQRRPSQNIGRVRPALQGRVVRQNRAQKRDANAECANNEILPRRFKRFLIVVKIDQKRRRERRPFNRDPHQSKIVGKQSQKHGKDEKMHESVIALYLLGENGIRFELLVKITG